MCKLEPSAEKLLALIREEFHSRLDYKQGWNVKEVKQAYQDAVNAVAVSLLSYNIGENNGDK